jgi:hypothetical protein
MTSGDWIALGSVGVSMVAFALASIAYRQQKRASAASEAAAATAQVSTDEQNLNDLIDKIQAGLATLSQGPSTLSQGQSTFKLENVVAESTAMAALQGQALEARRLIERSHITLDWFQNMVLAYAFSQIWDPAGAIPYWNGAVDGAKTPQAHIRGLTARAEFYYNRGLGDDWDLAREDYKEALRELRADPDQQGPDLVAQQASGMQNYQAGFEFNVGNDAMAVGLVADAFTDANAIGAPWRRLAALERLGNLVLVLQQKVIPPRNVLGPVAAELSRRGILPSTFPPATAALLSAPPNGSQASGLYGEIS